MHEGAIGAIFIALLVVAERTAAIGTQRVQRAITKHAIEGLPLRQCMTGVIRTFFVGKYAFIFHGSSYDKKTRRALTNVSEKRFGAFSRPGAQPSDLWPRRCRASEAPKA